jgi:DNA recombination protein RmuC
MEFSKHNQSSLDKFHSMQNQYLESMHKSSQNLVENTESAIIGMRSELNSQLEKLQSSNLKNLEKIRNTVEEKLHNTLEDRLGKSFALVNASLESVQKGLGEMKSIASGVGDLKKVLSNVKTRGILGEIQLGQILEEILSPSQYQTNVVTVPKSNFPVEFAIKLPGKNSEFPVLMPIDAKFPLDDYERMLLAYEKDDLAGVKDFKQKITVTINKMAKDIHTKYIEPPYTTEFGILFLPVEGLYAEIARIPGLLDKLQKDYKIMIAGPGNMAAFLNSLQMGFKTLSIEKRSSEVWTLLSKVKSEFDKFGSLLHKTQQKLKEASDVIEKAGVRSRIINKKLAEVEELPHQTSLVDVSSD